MNRIFAAIRRLFAQTPQTWEPGNTWGPEILVDPSGRSTAGERVNTTTMLRYAPIWYGVRKIAGHLGIMPVEIKRTMGDVVETGSKAQFPFLPLLECESNPLMSKVDVWETTQHHALISGNGRMGIYRDRIGNPLQLIPIHPDSCWTFLSYPDEEPDSPYGGWNTVDGNTRQGPITPNVQKWHYVTAWDGSNFVLNDRDVIHIRGLQHDGLEGIPLWRTAAESVGGGLAGQSYANRQFVNNAVPGVILEAPEGVLTDRAKAKEFLDTWNREQAGSENAGRTALLRYGVKANALSLSSKDAEMLAQRELSRQEAADWLGLEYMPGTESPTTYSNRQDAEISYVKNTLLIHTVKWEQELTRKLLRVGQRDRGWKVTLDESILMRGSPQERFEYYRIGREIGTLSEEETRRREGLPAERIEGEHYGNPNTTPGEPQGEEMMTPSKPPEADETEEPETDIDSEPEALIGHSEYKPADHLERDRWIYERHAEGALTLDEILSELETVHGQKWDILSSHQNLRVASHKYADFHGLIRVNRKTQSHAMSAETC